VKRYSPGPALSLRKILSLLTLASDSDSLYHRAFLVGLSVKQRGNWSSGITLLANELF